MIEIDQEACLAQHDETGGSRKYVSTGKAAQALDASPRTLLSHAASGRIPGAHQLVDGGGWRIPKEWVAKKKHEQSPEGAAARRAEAISRVQRRRR